ncbi:beta-N-acetylhexosaminidase [Polaribacter cellanae]|uniref:Family 20 glycosylhydrolase n=1 Tax=Polaribacter cellanae TaxID=2818493 RepID=A0A975H857_9FLAO|nr:family 20 glycosylhydrolase [Polaribacter cellanae]QTE21255.1 family 20 glycosylhydrolase [Polaribacter cellanae]
MKKFILLIILGVFHQFIFSQNNLSEKYNLMPWPQEIVENGQQFLITSNFTIGIDNLKNRKIVKATTRFLRRLSNRTGIFIEKGFAVNATEVTKPAVLIKYQRVGKLELHEDESYQLSIKNNQITINAITDTGAIRGLETLLQLTSHNKTNYFFEGVSIKDAPRFPWRGLMIDVARHYEPVGVLKRNLDAMASVKLNVFHWHLTDDQGFRVEVKSRPKLHELGSDGQYYTQNQIKEVVAYAADLGIRVVPEFDIPGHATSWLTAYPEIGSKDTIYSIERYAGIFDPTLDPTNPKTYEILDDVFSEIAPLFPDTYFHIGGDENEGKHWDENKKIQTFKKQHNLKTNHDLQNYFNIKVQKILKKNKKVMMGWDEILQPTLPKDVVIHSWRGKEAMLKAAKQGYKTILSKGYYIDLLKSVDHHYTNEPIKEDNDLTEVQLKNILGGEATMWSELVTPLTIDSRIWPRTAAIAERFWSHRNVKDLESMHRRLAVINNRLEELGITHIRNKSVILRNISNYQNTEALFNLTKICEPLKAYQRNKGGKEYKSYSPFTQFVDACNVDAVDVKPFNNAVDAFLINGTEKTKIISFFEKWIANNTAFQKINNTPTLATLEPLSRNLAKLSSLLLDGVVSGKLSKGNYDKAQKLIQELDKPVADTELAIISGLKKLVLNYKK